MKKFIPLIALAVIVVIGVGMVVGKGPQPEIVVPAEKLFAIGPLNVTNTLLTSWIVIVFLVGTSYLATRSMKLLPSGLQNFMESVVSFLLGQIEDIAGVTNGRRLFMVCATIFLFVITSNWFGLLPVFNAVGKTEDVGVEVFEQLASERPHDLKLDATKGTYSEGHRFAGTKMSNGSVSTIAIGEGAVDFEVRSGETPGAAFDRYVVFLAKTLAGYKISAELAEKPTQAQIREAAALLASTPDAPKLLLTEPEGHHGEGVEHHEVMSPTLGTTVYGVDFSKGKRIALVIPYFRGVFSDVNNTLALGLVGFFVIEFFGFRTLGFGYLKKFFNFSSPIAAFVGFLELLSEFIRIISFTFRLFGNIFAGEVLVLMLTFLVPFVAVDIIYGLELFVGFIQAAVFALLVLVFGAMAMEHHGEEEHHEGHEDEDGTSDAHHHTGAAQAQ